MATEQIPLVLLAILLGDRAIAKRAYAGAGAIEPALVAQVLSDRPSGVITAAGPTSAG